NWNWNFGDGNSSTEQNPQHTFSTAGNYNITLITKDNVGCADTTTKAITVNPLPVPGISPDTLICDIDSVLLTAIGGVSYAWSPSSSLSSAIGNSVMAKPKVSTTYTIIVTENNGCINTDSVKINVVDTVIAVAGPDTTICDG